MAIDEKYEERKEMKEMIEEERMTSADDQIGMFNHLAKVSVFLIPATLSYYFST